ncbi:MAG: 3'(2'),5'-bisphosphate nucleotidase CysQ [Beijerinckiaceae bacterium]
MPSIQEIAAGLLEAAAAGGRALLSASGHSVSIKPDGSPVTAADLASDWAIRNALTQRYPDIPSVSEEASINFPQEAARAPFFLIDPLDGTKEFLAGSPDFAICVALIVKQRPVAGVILAPAARMLCMAAGTATAFTLDDHLQCHADSARVLKLKRREPAGKLTLVTSHSHSDERSLRLVQHFHGCSHRTMGAAVKFMAVANGEADLYPRGTGSMEWDTAAGEAIILASGGAMLGEDGEPMIYGKVEQGFRNGPFIAGRSKVLVQSALNQWAAC